MIDQTQIVQKSDLNKSQSAIDPNLKLDKYDVNIYHAVFLMAPGVEHFGGNVTEQTFVEYVQRGGNLFVAADSTIGSAIGEVAALFGVEYDQPGRKVVSHIQEDNTFDRVPHLAENSEVRRIQMKHEVESCR